MKLLPLILLASCQVQTQERPYSVRQDRAQGFFYGDIEKWYIDTEHGMICETWEGGELVKTEEY